ncbi:MAG: hypothetical protein ACK5X3_16165, partial [Pseudomonadota bacterium]
LETLCLDGVLVTADALHTQSIRLDQAPFCTHKRSALTRVFANSMSFRIRAVMATLAGFPALRSENGGAKLVHGSGGIVLLRAA